MPTPTRNGERAYQTACAAAFVIVAANIAADLFLNWPMLDGWWIELDRNAAGRLRPTLWNASQLTCAAACLYSLPHALAHTVGQRHAWWGRGGSLVLSWESVLDITRRGHRLVRRLGRPRHR